MDIQKEIFEEFFIKLKDEKVPDTIISTLKSLWESGKFNSQQDILKAIEQGLKNECKD